jgi:hypothetical protein
MVASFLQAILTLGVSTALLATEVYLGFFVGARVRTHPSLRDLLQLLVLVGTRLYLVFLPVGQAWRYRGAALWVAVLVGAGVAVVRTRRHGRVETVTDVPAGKWPVRQLVLLALLLVVPSFAAPVAQHWDVSGWMDSQSYDRFAHRIATGQAAAGSSDFMPLYQYGLAAFYFLFGHFFFVQQIVNVLLGVAGVVLLALAGWNLFPSRLAVVLVVLWGALNPGFTYAVYFTQIESWYVPAICLALFLWSCYWRRPRFAHLVLLASSAAAIVNIRQQGLLLALALCLAPVAVEGIDRRERVRHTVTALAIVVLSLAPWTIRNAVVERRFSPFGMRSAAYLAILNDRRVPFYGIRYDQGFAELLAEYQQRYPDNSEREKVMMRDARHRLLEDPVWLGQAIFWRAVGFYGLLPPGVFAAEGPRATRADEWGGFLRKAMPLLLPIGASILGVVACPGRTSGFLLVLVAANLSVVLFSSTGGDPRISFPSLPIHILLGLAVFQCARDRARAFDLSALFGNGRLWAATAATALMAALLCRATLGRPFAYRPLREHAVVWTDGVILDGSRPSLNEDLRAGGGRRERSRVGQRVRATYIVSNEMYPPKYQGYLPWLPRIASDPRGDTYYFGYWPDGHSIGVSYSKAAVEPGVREGDAVEAEGVVLAEGKGDEAPYWIKAEKVRLLRKRAR